MHLNWLPLQKKKVKEVPSCNINCKTLGHYLDGPEISKYPIVYYLEKTGCFGTPRRKKKRKKSAPFLIHTQVTYSKLPFQCYCTYCYLLQYFTIESLFIYSRKAWHQQSSVIMLFSTSDQGIQSKLWLGLTTWQCHLG